MNLDEHLIDTACARSDCGRPAERGCRGYCETDYRYRLHIGVYGWRDAAQARAHVAELRRLGWTWEQIADASGLSAWVANRLHQGRTRRLLPESERALLAVPPAPQGSRRGTDNTGTRRRVQALAWMGWPCAEVARRAGTTQQSLATLILPRRGISHDLALRVAAVYDALCMRPGPSKSAAAKARTRGFAPPLAWREGAIDDPRARPVGVRRGRAGAAASRGEGRLR